MDTAFIVQPAEETSARLADLRDRINAASNTDNKLRTTVEDEIRAYKPSDFAEKVMSTLAKEDDQSQLSFWLQALHAVEEKHGKKFKSIIDAQIADRKAAQPDVEKPNEEELRKLREEYSEAYQMWKALENFAKISNFDLSKYGKFEAIRGPIAGGGKRIARGLFYNIDGKDLPAKRNKAGEAAKDCEVSLAEFKKAFAAAAGLPEDKVGDADDLPDRITFEINNHSVIVTKEEADSDEDEDETAEASE